MIATAGGDRATWAVDGFLDREAMDLHLKGQLDRTMSTNNFAEIVKGIGWPPRACSGTHLVFYP